MIEERTITVNLRKEKTEAAMSASVVSFASWETLRPFLERCVNLGNNEELVGLTISEDGIQFGFRYKQ